MRQNSSNACLLARSSRTQEIILIYYRLFYSGMGGVNCVGATVGRNDATVILLPP